MRQIADVGDFVSFEHNSGITGKGVVSEVKDISDDRYPRTHFMYKVDVCAAGAHVLNFWVEKVRRVYQVQGVFIPPTPDAEWWDGEEGT